MQRLSSSQETSPNNSTPLLPYFTKQSEPTLELNSLFRTFTKLYNASQENFSCDFLKAYYKAETERNRNSKSVDLEAYNGPQLSNDLTERAVQIIIRHDCDAIPAFTFQDICRSHVEKALEENEEQNTVAWMIISPIPCPSFHDFLAIIRRGADEARENQMERALLEHFLIRPCSFIRPTDFTIHHHSAQTSVTTLKRSCPCWKSSRPYARCLYKLEKFMGGIYSYYYYYYYYSN